MQAQYESQMIMTILIGIIFFTSIIKKVMKKLQMHKKNSWAITVSLVVILLLAAIANSFLVGKITIHPTRDGQQLDSKVLNDIKKVRFVWKLEGKRPKCSYYVYGIDRYNNKIMINNELNTEYLIKKLKVPIEEGLSEDAGPVVTCNIKDNLPQYAPYLK